MHELRREDSPDFYEILEVSPRASHDVIQAAYRVLARTAHPDRNPGADAEHRIRQINAAWEVLGDPSSRARYDLEALRARRRERLSNVVTAEVARPQRSTARARPRALQRAPEITRPPGDDKVRLRVVQAVVVLTALMVLGGVMLFIVWAALDSAVGDDKLTMIDRPAVFTRPLLDTSERLNLPRP